MSLTRPARARERGDDGPVPSGIADDADALAAAALTLARRFAAGATLWCVAPGAEHHARHVAVEFVHPVIVGKRSLPALAVPVGHDLLGTTRDLVRPGDVVLAIGRGDQPALDSLLRRGDAWGVATVLLAIGPRPPSAVADHVIGAGSEDGSGTVLAYHLLWELTHVVFEHPGLLPTPVEMSRDEVCVTCSDEGRVVEVRAVRDGGLAEVRAGGALEVVDVAVVDGVGPGDLLLVHAGLALTVLERAPS